MNLPTILLVGTLCGVTAHAQLFISALDTDHPIGFEATVPGVNNGNFAGSGFTATPATGQLDSDAWAIAGLSDGGLVFGGTQTSGDFARGSSDGGVTTGGLYAFDVDGAGNLALGVQATDSDFTPGTITLRVGNATGVAVTAVAFGFDVWNLNDQNRSTAVAVAYSTDGTSYINLPLLALETRAALDAPASWNSDRKADTVTGLSVADNGSFYLRWTFDDKNGSGSRDEVALDNITVSFVPEPGSGGILGLGALLLGTRRRR